MFEERNEVYLLGNITKEGFHHDMRKGPVYLFYNRSPIYSEISPCGSIIAVRGHVLRETCGFFPTHAYSSVNPEYNSHAWLWANGEIYADIVKRTMRTGEFLRHMEERTGRGETKEIPYDLSKWDEEILKLCAKVPTHIKEVIGLTEILK